MRKISIILMLTIMGYYFWAINKQEIDHPHKPIYLKAVEQDFHDDYDSTYYYYGCQYNTFKSNHKCNGK